VVVGIDGDVKVPQTLSGEDVKDEMMVPAAVQKVSCSSETLAGMSMGCLPQRP
jgi:hypothetical protein